MVKEFEDAGGRIDKIYYSVDFETDSPNRKPNPGMGLQAQKDFPEIDFSKSYHDWKYFKRYEIWKKFKYWH